MKYKCSIVINLPVKEVVKLWEDEKNFKEWQDGFIRIDHLSGEIGEPGAKSRIYLNDGNRKMELDETIISNDLPKEKTAQYVHVHMTNTQTSSFESIDENRTRYISKVEYTQFNSFMPRMMAKFFPGMFKRQSEKWMRQFKEFAEKSR